MRVIAGEAKGRPLKAVPGMNTRPTTDKVKEAMFSMIGPFFDGGHVLDLFAGTGGLGIEALSRGVDKAVFIDSDRQSISIVKSNVEAARLQDRAEIYCNTAERALKMLEKRGIAFRLAFLDPPYRMKNADELMADMASRGLLVADAIVVVEHESGHRYAESFGGFELRKLALYGETAVAIYDYRPAGGQGGTSTHEPQ
ncbi:DNA methyltransferase [Paenibacillus darwinianus]|uniref:DNA methyltransferase n=1 Tax=Paenibacillus darwinianus TaxID=1380763 RepID=A0A9W5RYY4_9BACL|nr:16S rRNA (guanine(966)-N(2))-methyltransferase RsmD [Paenibacillus darwinianus]EXX84691.1 DNA methyltransferase [Paenibacillus darwinianus]EXX85180.1 DNA methyltransferase [Paenibacillus darwinianus]EXX85246.1 DNA methyltransferase [Paenibacillus darwinianus]